MARRPAARHPTVRRRNPPHEEDVLDSLGFFGFHGLHAGKPRDLVATMVRAITTFAGIVRGSFIVDTLERTEGSLEGLRIRKSARGVTLTYDGLVAVNYEGKGKLTENILNVPGWVTYFDYDRFGEDDALNDFHVAGSRDPRLVGAPVSGLGWDFSLSDFGVAVVKRYSWAEIEHAAGSREAFFSNLLHDGAKME